MDKFADTLSAIDAATTRLGGSVSTASTNLGGVQTRVQALVDKLADAPTADEVAAFKTAVSTDLDKISQATDALDVVASTLTGIAADPANPVPVEPPVV